ncbi:MAG: F0F1 ATP synthase subunit A [Caulobacteraceae bacterium]|nr:F0F1 ATP synthase subunit A [Caulobacteraceae bacterium]
MADPLHQFKIEPLIDFGDVTLPVVGTQHIAFTNSHLAMTIAFGLVVLMLQLFTARATVVPGRMQAVGETFFGMIDGIVDSIIGHEGKKLFPFVFTVFTFILAMNFIGLFLTFTATSQIAVTATFGVMTILLVLAIGFAKHGLGFFKLFVPSGVPIFVLPFVVIIEFVSFLLRPITLTLRLFGNMMGGHVALKVFAGFVVIGVTGAVGWLGAPIALLSMGMTVGLTALEFLVAFLQAFVFAVLTCIYLNDVVNLGHGH